MERLRKIIHFRPIAWAGPLLGLLFMAMATVGQAAGEPPKTGAVEKQPIEGQNLCPSTGPKETCQVWFDCPSVKVPGKTVCQATIDCPAAKEQKKKKK